MNKKPANLCFVCVSCIFWKIMDSMAELIHNLKNNIESFDKIYYHKINIKSAEEK